MSLDIRATGPTDPTGRTGFAISLKIQAVGPVTGLGI